jgi:XTP/dITP diphosphohydrolase
MLVVSPLILASSNEGKLLELRELLAPLGIGVETQGEHGVSSAEETGSTFVENALLKARHAARCTGLPAIADDSGICVDALDGAPGIYSARFAGPGASDQDNLKKLLVSLDNVDEPGRTARYECVIVFMRNASDPSPIIAQGTWEGIVLREPRGDYGFGYDPVFQVPDLVGSVAQQSPAAKNAVSHRAQAMRQLLSRLRDLG